MAQHRHRAAVKERNAAQNASVLAALPVAALLKEIREQRIDILSDLGAPGIACHEYLLLRGQIGKLSKQRVAPRCKLREFCALRRAQRALDLLELADHRLDHARFTPPSWSLSSRDSTARICARGTIWSTKPCSCWNSLR